MVTNRHYAGRISHYSHTSHQFHHFTHPSAPSRHQTASIFLSIHLSISDSQKTEFPNLKTTRGKSKGWSDPGGVRRAGRNSIAPPGKPNVSWNVGFTRKGREVVGIPNILKQKNMGVHCSFKTVSFWVLLFLTVHVFSSSKPVSLHPRGNTWIASQ